MPLNAMAASLPITCAAAIVTASGITGLTVSARRAPTVEVA